MTKRKLFRLIKVVLLLYGTVGIAVYYLQNFLLFKPKKVAQSILYNFSIPHKEINISFNEEANINIVQFTTAVATKGVVLYFHGNRANISRYAKFAPNFTNNGYEVWMIDYPGYGKSTGPITEQRLYDFANQLYILAKSKFTADSITIYGKSLGSGIAAWLASKKNCKQLILETPYYSMTSLFSFYLPIYPVSKMIHFKIPSYEYVKHVMAPITIFHGTSDWVIPYSNAKKLMGFLKPLDKFITIEGASHNNLNDFPIFHEKLDLLLK